MIERGSLRSNAETTRPSRDQDIEMALVVVANATGQLSRNVIRLRVPRRMRPSRFRRTCSMSFVSGTHGRHGVQRWLPGSTAEGVVRHASKPILLIRGIEHPADCATPIERIDQRRVAAVLS